jgi:hypothetical protein
MKFLELIARNDSLAELLAREHGKTVADAKGDIPARRRSRRIRLRRAASDEGRIHRWRRPRHRHLFDAPAARRRRRHHAVQLPGDDPDVEVRAAIACGNAFILKPSERDPGVPMRLAELMHEAGLPPGILNVVNGDKEASTRSSTIPTSRRSASSARRRSPNTSIRAARERKARAVLRRRQEPHDHHAGRRHGPGGRCADRRRLRLGRRALHGDLGRVPVGKEPPTRWSKLIPRVEKPEDRPLDRQRARISARW